MGPLIDGIQMPLFVRQVLCEKRVNYHLKCPGALNIRMGQMQKACKRINTQSVGIYVTGNSSIYQNNFAY